MSVRTPVLGHHEFSSPTSEATMDALALLLMLVAVVLFVIAGITPAWHGRLIAFGLACLALALLVGGLGEVNIDAD